VGVMRIPDFFLIGAPKCGTTALYTYFASHRGIFMPSVKEPHFFSLDLPGLRKIVDQEEYCGLFAHAARYAKVGEASASYLFSKVAVKEILRLNADARFVAILRNPIEMAYALHSERVRSLSENALDFEQAWLLQEDRRQGRFLPSHPEPRMLQYRDLCRFGEQLELFFQSVPRKQRAVYIFEDFQHDPGKIYREILGFLDLADDGRSEFPHVNANSVLRRRWLAQIHGVSRAFLKRRGWYTPAKRAANAMGWEPSVLVNRWSKVERPRVPLRHGFRQTLARELEKEVCKVEEVLKRKLDCWTDWGSNGR
jgi:hypothetical protein